MTAPFDPDLDKFDDMGRDWDNEDDESIFDEEFDPEWEPEED